MFLQFRSPLLLFKVMLLSYKGNNEYTMGIWNPTIWNPDFLTVGFQMVRFTKSGFSYGYGPNHLKTGLFKIWTFFQISNDFWPNGSHLSGFQMVGLRGFRSPSKSRPFATQPLLEHSKSRLVLISNPHCNECSWDLNNGNIWIMNFYLPRIQMVLWIPD